MTLDPDEILERLLTTERGWRVWQARPPFDAATLEEDLERIRRLYRSHGFYQAEARTELDWSADRRGVHVRIDIEEGAAVSLEELRITWPEAAPLTGDEREALTAELALRLGERFSARRYEASRDTLLAALADRGHPDAGLDGGARVLLEEGTARVEWRVLPGPHVRVGPIHIEGREQVEEWVLLSKLGVAEGDVYDASAIRASERAIYALDLFRSVSIRAERPEQNDDTGAAGSETVWPLRVTIRERTRRSLRAGVGFGTEDRFRVRARWRHRNLFGEGESLAVAGKYSSLSSGAELRFLHPRFRRPDTALEVPLSYEREDESSYEADLLRAGVELRRPFRRRWTARAGWQLERGWIRDIDVTLPGQHDTYLTSGPYLGLRRDTVDDRLEPTRGSLLDLSIAPLLSAFGSDLDTLEIRGELRGFFSWHWLVLALRAEAGSIELFRGTERGEVPVYDRFFGGGSSSVRGYKRHEIGPTDPVSGEALGGLSWAELSAELRFPLWGPLGGVLFADAGQVRSRPHDLKLDAFFTSVGAGLRFATPIGPLRLDVGVPLEKGPGIPDYRLHFSVGHAF